MRIHYTVPSVPARRTVSAARTTAAYRLRGIAMATTTAATVLTSLPSTVSPRDAPVSATCSPAITAIVYRESTSATAITIAWIIRMKMSGISVVSATLLNTCAVYIIKAASEILLNFGYHMTDFISGTRTLN